MAAMTVGSGPLRASQKASAAVLWFPGTYRFWHGRQQSNEEHRKEQIVVRADTMWKGLFEFTHENAKLMGD
jgi:hypothetical protein